MSLEGLVVPTWSRRLENRVLNVGVCVGLLDLDVTLFAVGNYNTNIRISGALLNSEKPESVWEPVESECTVMRAVITVICM